RDLFRQKINDAQSDKSERDESEPERNFDLADLDIERYTEFAFAAMGIAKYEYRQSFCREAPHYAECISFAEHKDVSAAEQDCRDLQDHNQIQDAMRRTKLSLRVPEPLGQNAVLRNSIQHSIRTDNGGINSACKHQCSNHGHKAAKGNPGPQGSDKIHSKTTDRVVLKCRAYRIRDNHHDEESHAGGENQAIGENDESGLLEILEFRMFDLAVNLRHGLFTAHGENGVTQSYQDTDETDRIWQRRILQPPQSIACINNGRQ